MCEAFVSINLGFVDICFYGDIRGIAKKRIEDYE
jgi:hypothetical protein